jgi:RHS repeat-associated protein
VGSAVNKGAQNTEFTQFTLYDESRQPLAELNAQGQIQRQYIWLADLPLAVIDTPQGIALGVQRKALQQVWADMQQIASGWLGSSSEAIVWLHTNHLGAPEAATDAAGQVVWRASYAPFGAATVIAASTSASTKDGVTGAAFGAVFQLNLRLPGQVLDPETGLHHNRKRYYDPALGQYLTPDPLGTPDGPNPYAYVAFNPLTNIDPDGLILFAFDGTGNGDPPLGESASSNVVRFRDAYNDGSRNYVSGVGTDYQDAEWGAIQNVALDAGVNRTGTRRIERMMVYLMEEARAADDNTALDIDIIGFSRGAAQARDFANNIIRYSGTTATGDAYNLQTDAQGWLTYGATVRNAAGQNVRFEGRQCVNFRFLGLWDTVLSTNSGRDYRMGIPIQFEYVAHAVALNEYRNQPFGTLEGYDNGTYYDSTRVNLPDRRHWGGFPLVSIGVSTSRPGQVRIERGFIGAHADIGGGYRAEENGLSTVALSWMVGQAQIAGVAMRPPPAIDMNSPVIHDQSNMLRFGDPRNAPAQFTVPAPVFGTNTYRPEDRQVSGAVSGTTQRTMGFGPAEAGGNRSLTNADTHGFISYWERDPLLTGEARTTNSIIDIVNLRNRTGSVDMQGYMSWLRQHGYVFAGEY